MEKKHELGTSLIEVLITVSILSFGMLGIAHIQTSAVTNTYLAYQYSQAAFLAQSITEDIRANRGAALAGLYEYSPDSNPPTPDKNCSDAACTPSELAKWDLATWNALLENEHGVAAEDHSGKLSLGLASGKLGISCQNSCSNHSVQLITIYWDARHNGATGTGCDSSSASDLSCFHLAYAL